MNKLRGIWYTLVYLRERSKLLRRYLLVWEPQSINPCMSREEMRELEGRMASSPLHYEYERIQKLRERAIDSLCK